MAKARIFRPARNAMQQGQAKTGTWVLEFAPESALRPDPLMGWAGGGDTTRQVRLTFETLDAAKLYARRRGIPVTIQPDHARVVKPKSYADNFRWDRTA